MIAHTFESGVKHHKPNQTKFPQFYKSDLLAYIIFGRFDYSWK
jgi:hypothetical protein